MFCADAKVVAPISKQVAAITAKREDFMGEDSD
jgi:hypothetical protein